MENQKTHAEIDQAMQEGRWQFAYQLAGDALKADRDDNLAALKCCIARYEMGDYSDALPMAAALCLNLHDTIAETLTAKQPIPAELALTFVESRALVILCQLRSAGSNTNLALVQLHEVHRWLFTWEASEVLAREAKKPILHSLEARLGLG